MYEDRLSPLKILKILLSKTTSAPLSPARIGSNSLVETKKHSQVAWIPLESWSNGFAVDRSLSSCGLACVQAEAARINFRLNLFVVSWCKSSVVYPRLTCSKFNIQKKGKMIF